MCFQGYLFDIYLHKESSEEPPCHIGFTFIIPSNMKWSNGEIVCPITSVHHQPLGELKSKELKQFDLYCNLHLYIFF